MRACVRENIWIGVGLRMNTMVNACAVVMCTLTYLLKTLKLFYKVFRGIQQFVSLARLAGSCKNSCKPDPVCGSSLEILDRCSTHCLKREKMNILASAGLSYLLS